MPYVLNCPITSFDLYGLIDESRSHVFHRDFNSSGQSYADAQHERFINAYNPFVSSSSGYSSDVPYRSHSSDRNYHEPQRHHETHKASKSESCYLAHVTKAAFHGGVVDTLKETKDFF